MGIFLFRLEILPHCVEISLGVVGLIFGVVGFIMSFFLDFLTGPMRFIAFIELVLTFISGGLALFDAIRASSCCQGPCCNKCSLAACPFLLEFVLWFAAAWCSLLSSDYIVPENYVYTPEPSCDNCTNHTCEEVPRGSFCFATGQWDGRVTGALRTLL